MPVTPKLADDLVIEMRRLCREENWTIPDCVKRFGCSSKSAARAVRGVSHKNLPDPVPDAQTRLLGEAAVIEMRRLAGEGISHSKVAEMMGLNYKTVTNIISGRAYAHLPGAIPTTNRLLTDEQVIEMRRLYREENWTQYALAAYFGLQSGSTVSAIVRGVSYKDLPGAHKKPLGSLPDALALEMREFQRDSPNWTQEDICELFEVPRAVGRNILSGVSYKHLPMFERHDRRRFSFEQVLWMRLLYQRGHTLVQIGAAYECNASTVSGIVKGEYYAEVPEATPLRRAGKPRLLTEEQVAMARRMYRTRYVTGKAIARELGVGDSIYNVIRGRAYKELPGHVPQHVTSIRRGVSTRGARKPQLSSS